jgi:isoleucyl-tRNA synthetase
LQGKKDVEAMGIAEYNRHCRATVMNISGEWKHMVERTGRWIDFENDYRTLYPSYMESCWYSNNFNNNNNIIIFNEKECKKYANRDEAQHVSSELINLLLF